jgi:hypothetical protein
MIANNRPKRSGIAPLRRVAPSRDEHVTDILLIGDIAGGRCAAFARQLLTAQAVATDDHDDS